jgi:hypothetical protein
MDENENEQHCRIEEQLGRVAPCPPECAFRDGSGCVFEGVDFAGRDDLARWLHELRGRLENQL